MTVTDRLFTDRLRTQTDDDHKAAEQASFIGDLLGGRLDGASVTNLLAQLHFVYEALESTGDALRDNPVAGPFISPDLIRGPSLAADLRAALGDSWREAITPLPATTTYADHLRSTATDPVSFLAHHYLRYLGDLSGGQAIRVLTQREYNIPDDRLTFFQFDAIAKPKVFKDEYRDRLNALNFDAATEARFVDECRVGYRMNKAIFEGLEQQ